MGDIIIRKGSYFVAMSGGYDSLFLVQKLLEAGNEVHAGYFEIVNNGEKTVRELAAIDGAIKVFLEMGRGAAERFYWHKTVFKIDLAFQGVEEHATYFAQMPAWIAGALYCKVRVDNFAFGYVRNDDMCSWVPELQRLWAAAMKFSKWPMRLELPLLKVGKPDIIAQIDPRLAKLATFCENAGEADNCGECHPCRRWKALEDEDQVPETQLRFREPKAAASVADILTAHKVATTAEEAEEELKRRDDAKADAITRDLIEALTPNTIVTAIDEVGNEEGGNGQG